MILDTSLTAMKGLLSLYEQEYSTRYDKILNNIQTKICNFTLTGEFFHYEQDNFNLTVVKLGDMKLLNQDFIEINDTLIGQERDLDCFVTLRNDTFLMMHQLDQKGKSFSINTPVNVSMKVPSSMMPYLQ